MKSTVGSRNDKPRAQVLVLALLSTVFAATIVNRMGSDAIGQGARDLMAVEYSSRDLPELLTISEAFTTTAHQDRSKGRDPFAFEVLRDAVPPKPKTNTAEIVKTKLDTPKVRDEGAPKVVSPEFEWKYLGFFGPKYLRVAAFRKNGDVEVAVLGQVVNDAFVLRSIGPESVGLEIVGKPAAGLLMVLLSDD